MVFITYSTHPIFLKVSLDLYSAYTTMEGIITCPRYFVMLHIWTIVMRKARMERCTHKMVGGHSEVLSESRVTPWWGSRGKALQSSWVLPKL